MRIALVLYCSNRFGGAERRLIRVASEIAKEHDVYLVARGCTHSHLKESLDLSECSASNLKGIVAIRSKSQYWENMRVLLYLKKLDVEIVHVIDACGFNSVLTLWMHFLGKAVLLTVANGLYFYDYERGSLDRNLEFVLPRVDVLDILYPDQEKFYRDRASNGCMVGVTPGTFTDFELFQPSTKKEKIFAFLAARLEKQKNPQLMIDAVRQCAGALRSEGYRVLICGRGWEEESIREQVAIQKLDDIVEMPGYINSKEVLPKASVLCALQSINNYPSQTIAEAAASGCFVIATDVGETYRLIDPDYSIAIEPTSDALATAMRDYMFLAEEKKQRLVSSSRNYAKAHFSLSPSVEYFRSLYEHCKP